MSDSTDDRWEQADRLLDAALELEPGEREAFLDRECGEDRELRGLVGRLLANAETDGTWLTPGGGLDQPMVTGLDPSAAEDDTDLSGTTIDRYRVLRELGRGGMAIVYLAERADGEFEHKVALKLIKHVASIRRRSLQRFARERQILARGQRIPHIARLLDGGTTAEGSSVSS